MIENPCFNWEKLQDIFYRNREICGLEWPSIDKQQKQQHETVFSTSTVVISTPDTIEIFDYTGSLLLSLSKKKFGEIVKLEFNENEELVIVTSKTINVVKNYLPLEIEEFDVSNKLNGAIWDYKNGTILTKETQDIYQVLNNDKLNLLYKNEGSFTILTKNHWNCNLNKIILLDINDVLEFVIEKRILSNILKSQWHRVEISNSGFVCLYNLKFNKLRVFKDPSTALLEHDLEVIPTDIKWCSDDSIVCSFTDEIKIYGPGNTYISFWYPNNITSIATEIDGLKVITKEKVHLVSRVPQSTANIFRIGSTEPAAILLDSLDLLSNHAPKSIANLRLIDLKVAVLECIDAAKHEFDITIQKKLLSAAAFGKASLDKNTFDSNIFVEACRLITLLNTIRSYGFFITIDEYCHMKSGRILNLLLTRHKYYEAVKVCELLNDASKFSILFKHWAVSKIRLSSDMEDDELLTIIKNQLKVIKFSEMISLNDIVHVSYLEGRFKLAKGIALMERNPQLKIVELLEMDENNVALEEALKTNCPELVLSFLLKCQTSLTLSQFTKLLTLDMPDNQLFLYSQSFLHEEFLFDYYRQTDRFFDLGQLILEQSKKQRTIQPFLSQIKDLYNHYQHDHLLKHEVDLFKKEESLWKYQDNLSGIFNENFNELSLGATLGKLIEMKQDRYVHELVKEFKISDKRFYHTKCKVLIDGKRFDELQQFASERRSPIGYLPFYKYLMKKKYEKEAVIYINMISGISYEQKKKMYLECNSYQEAVQIAKKERDIGGLREIFKLVPADQTHLKKLINEIIGAI
ncbi:hypothetical protein Kpol_333p9 [Vanderwaltozyma polyspora DSM 70294]|uniref:Probable vacuolar protein sorting-associated protein 16 homolog n=1 Tax=Vanderwaltozyma polyspora (strain ATCC 22028 / DSM 70294 / BCRC 21397 / CBS 2163 / NBRC 10782 / NRRL Y-8283 / UCD 57-17) TaxID=436907 RepID=A7TSM6_VANPO|nr:uncharacterized protein Kpol_333p9 [Vanderwaltozyma polyspora DSM 70294]EDO14739.1 hypothetical protein Kpol_333p9 [Vanderwaltozyma polyspora DSM 70294]